MGGSNSIIVCHDMAMMFGLPFPAVVTITTGPGSSRPYTLDKGKDLLGISQFQNSKQGIVIGHDSFFRGHPEEHSKPARGQPAGALPRRMLIR
jgi:hypothetical protein